MENFLDIVVTYLPYVISLAALIFSASKQRHEVNNIDSETLKNYADTVEKVGKQYNDLLKEFTEYKRTNEKIIADLNTKVANLTQKNLEFAATIDKLQCDNEVLANENRELREAKQK